MEEKIEKIKEIKYRLSVELEKAKVLLKICEDEIVTQDLDKTDINIISGIVHDIVSISAKLAEDIERVTLN